MDMEKGTACAAEFVSFLFATKGQAVWLRHGRRFQSRIVTFCTRHVSSSATKSSFAEGQARPWIQAN